MDWTREGEGKSRMRVTIYLNSTDAVSQQVREIRSSHTHCLLALTDQDGILLWDRRSRMQHALTLEEFLALFPIERIQAALQ
jgi:hypothetical protein